MVLSHRFLCHRQGQGFSTATVKDSPSRTHRQARTHPFSPFPSSARQGCTSINPRISATPKLHLLQKLVLWIVSQDSCKNSWFTVFRDTFYSLSLCCHVSLLVPCGLGLFVKCNPELLGAARWLSSYGTARLSPAHVPSLERRDETDRDPCEPVKLSSTGARNKKTIQRW